MLGIMYGQSFQKGNLVGFHVGTVNLDPDVTFNQWKEYALEKYVPAFNKEFEGDVTLYYADGERGEFKNYVGMYLVFKSVEVRDKYIPEESKTSEMFNSKWEKLKPVRDELDKLGEWSADHWTDWVIL